MGVLIRPGAYEFTVMLYLPSSSAGSIRCFVQEQDDKIPSLTGGLCKASDSELAGGICGSPMYSPLTNDRTSSDDPPSTSLLDHLLCCVFVAQERATRIDGHHSLPLI